MNMMATRTLLLLLSLIGLLHSASLLAGLTTCPASLDFGPATSPVLPANPQCRYGSAKCLDHTKRHAGIDYPGSGKAVAIAAGTVVKIEPMSVNDHGLGTTVIVSHVLPGPNCSVVYSSYSRLAQVAAGLAPNAKVAKGQVLGVIGGSGYGKANYFPSHLHLEMKATADTGNSLGAGNQTKTCDTGPLNAQAGTCWGYVGTASSPASIPDEYGYLNPADYLNKNLTEPAYRQISAGVERTCAVKADNTLACWGSNSGYGLAMPPSGRFKQVSAGDVHACGIKADNTLTCWGKDALPAETAQPTGQFRQVSVGKYHACAIQLDNTLSCWGHNNFNQLTTVPTGTFKQISAGDDHSCGPKLDNSVVCWGNNNYNQSLQPTGRFKQVTSSYFGNLGGHTCAIRTDNSLICWGNNSEGQTAHPGGSYLQVGTGPNYTCGLKTDGSLVCWGSPNGGTPPTGQFKQISIGYAHSCAMKPDNSVACWGLHNKYGEATPPSGTYKQVSASINYICAVKTDGHVACWGDTLPSYRTTPPPDRFTQVSVGDYHVCGLKTNGRIACWDGNAWGESTPPTGKFKQVSAGDIHTCALKTDNSLVCWGDNSAGESTTPAGSFKQVSAGWRYTCAIKADSSVACWGYNYRGQSNSPPWFLKRLCRHFLRNLTGLPSLPQEQKIGDTPCLRRPAPVLRPPRHRDSATLRLSPRLPQ